MHTDNIEESMANLQSHDTVVLLSVTQVASGAKIAYVQGPDILRILTVVDDLERALALVPDDAVAPGWLEGLQLVRRNLQNLLDAEGVTKIEAEGKPFEPWEHEAIFYEETAESEEGLVLKVFRDGYRQHDRIVRPAQVSVAKAPEAQHQAETTLEEE